MSDGFPAFAEARALDGRRSWTATVESFDQYHEILYYTLTLAEVGRAAHTFIAAVDPGDAAAIERALHDIAATGRSNTRYAGYQLQYAPTCRGWLVGMGTPLPTDAALYAAEGGAICGCNQLRCRSCDAYVRHFDNLRCGDLPLAADEAARLYDAADPQAFAPAREDASTRAYVCRCNFEQVTDALPLEWLPDATWFCGGHPQR